MKSIEEQEAELRNLQLAFAETSEQAETLHLQMQQMSARLQQVQSVRCEQLKAIQEKKDAILQAKTMIASGTANEAKV